MVGAMFHMQNQWRKRYKKVKNKEVEEQWQQMEWGTNHFNNNCN